MCKFASVFFLNCCHFLFICAMIVRVNDTRIRIFDGATVGDVLLRYSVRNAFEISKVRTLVAADSMGHILDHAAPLRDKQVIKILNL